MNRFPLGTSPCGTPWWVRSIVIETQTLFMAYENITQVKTKKNKMTPLQKVNMKLMKTSINSFNRRNPNHQTIPIPDSKNNRDTLQTNQYQKSYGRHHYYTNNKSKTIKKDTQMETIWKTKHKNIPLPNPKLLKRSYKIPRRSIVFP